GGAAAAAAGSGAVAGAGSSATERWAASFSRRSSTGARARLRRRRSARNPNAPRPNARRRFTSSMLHSGRFSPRPSRRHPMRRPGGGADSVHEKEEFGRVNEYEIMLLLDPDLPEERASEVLQRIRTSVEAAKGSWDGHEPWGRRRLAFEIDHHGEAVYHLLLFTAPPETLAEITRVLKTTDGGGRPGPYRRLKGGHTKAPAQNPAPAPPPVGPPV